VDVQFLAAEHVVASSVMGSPEQDEEARTVEQILDQVAPLRSGKRVSVNRPWTLVLIIALVVAIVGLFANRWR
jgi:hypothetical protein